MKDGDDRHGILLMRVYGDVWQTHHHDFSRAFNNTGSAGVWELLNTFHGTNYTGHYSLGGGRECHTAGFWKNARTCSCEAYSVG